MDFAGARHLQKAMLSNQRPDLEVLDEMKRKSLGDPDFINKVMAQVMQIQREDEEHQKENVEMSGGEDQMKLTKSDFSDLCAIQRREKPDAEEYIKMLEPYVGAQGHIVDIGSMSGFIATCYADHWPDHEVVASDLAISEDLDPTKFWGISLLRKTLSQLSCSATSPHRERYLSMCERSRSLDVLQPAWEDVGHLNASCAAVVCTALLNTNGSKTPHMWRNVLAGAAKLLRVGGILLIFDCNFGSLGDRNVVDAYAQRIGLELVEHAFHHHGRQNSSKECDVYKLILRRSERRGTSSTPELSSGDLVLIDGLKGKPDLNGATGVLEQLRNERWGVHIAAGVSTKRSTVSVRMRPENITSLMSCS